MGIRPPDWTNRVPPLEGTRPSRRVERPAEEAEKEEHQEPQQEEQRRREPKTPEPAPAEKPPGLDVRI
ncbi:MAG: hypothetical protein M0Z27_11720 [Thermaerobacter sp.]|jgi:hypothetical protein|nr:hypothetical protein [Thermaerobacter sp.]MDA8146713.1 hypothetical protein [Thermaerobacter sp.]